MYSLLSVLAKASHLSTWVSCCTPRHTLEFLYCYNYRPAAERVRNRGKL